MEAEPIVVTAPKRASALDSLPMSVAVVRLDPTRAIAPENGTTLVAAESEGLSMTGTGTGRNRLFLRGVADGPFNGETQSTVAVVFDETRLTYAAPNPDIRLVDVDRVEVLKGPQGTLYGSGTLGGIYHIVPRRAKLGETSLAAYVGGETVAHGARGWSASAATNIPLVTDTAALRLVGYSAREAGWIDTGERRDSNQVHVLGARANLGIEPGSGWRVDLSALLQLLESRDSGYVYADGARKRPAQMLEPHDNDMRHLSFRLTRKTPGIDIILSSGISWHEVGNTLDATVGATGFGLAAPKLLSDERSYRVWDSEARIVRVGSGIQWLAGISHVEARQTKLWTLASLTGASQVIDDDYRRTREIALFGNATVPLFETVKLDAGVRLFRTTAVEARLLPGGQATSRRHRSGAPPSFALSWQTSATQFVYVRYASAYRQGGSDSVAGGAFEALKSDELKTVEAGWRRTLGRVGRLDVGLFASRWENVQSDVLDTDGKIKSRNVGNARILGAEATLEFAFRPGWELEAGANITNAMLVRNMLGRVLDDRRLPIVPDMTARLALTHKFKMGRADLKLRASMRYVGPQRLSFDPAIDRPMRSYVETRLQAQADLEGVRLTISAENLLNTARDGFAYGNPLRFFTTRQFTPQRPPHISFGISSDF